MNPWYILRNKETLRLNKEETYILYSSFEVELRENVGVMIFCNHFTHPPLFQVILLQNLELKEYNSRLIYLYNYMSWLNTLDTPRPD